MFAIRPWKRLRRWLAGSFARALREGCGGGPLCRSAFRDTLEPSLVAQLWPSLAKDGPGRHYGTSADLTAALVSPKSCFSLSAYLSSFGHAGWYGCLGLSLAMDGQS